MASKTMKTTPAVTCLKLLLCIFTIILWFIGLGLLVGGVYSKIELESYEHLSTANYSSAPYVVIGIGVFMMLIGFFGCYSISKGNTCMLRTFAFALAIFFLAEVAFALVVIVYRSSVHTYFTNGTQIAITRFNEKKYKDAINNAQTMLHCCGSLNYTDYWRLDVPNKHKGKVPESCCKNETLCKTVQSSDHGWIQLPDDDDDEIANYIYLEGCPSKVFLAVNKNLGMILGVLFGVAGFQLIGLILSCCLASTINANKYELV